MKRLKLLLVVAVFMFPDGFFLSLEGKAMGQTKSEARPVYVAVGMTAENFVALTANVAASDDQGVVLLDAPKSREFTKAFLKAYRPSATILVGTLPGGGAALAKSLEVPGVSAVEWQDDMPEELWKHLFAKAPEVVVSVHEPRQLLLQAACLAGAAKAPLYVLKGRPESEAVLRRLLALWETRTVHAVGEKAALACRDLPKMEVLSIPTEEAVNAAYLKRLTGQGAIRTLVLANPGDMDRRGGMSSLAPWVALQRRGQLLLTNDTGKDAGTLIQAALANPALSKADHLILVADLASIPTERRPNPLAGKDEFIDMEPPAFRVGETFSFATGRLFHAEPGIVSLMLARQRLLNVPSSARKALVVSNPGGGLPLLETISRNTANELRNAGYETSALFHHDANRKDVRRLFAEQDIFLWEGHHSTLIDYGIPYWPEPTKPSLVFLQSCLALTEGEAQPFLRRGAVGVVGSPFRNYSASGSAFTLAYFDALLYDRQSLGEALRQAKNFLLCYAQLKEKRLGDAAKLSGASLRSAWAFTLWGDPTVHLPAPAPPADALPAFRSTLGPNRLTFVLPSQTYQEVRTEKYTAKLWPNGRLAGYLVKGDDDAHKKLVPLLFAEVTFSKAPPGQVPIWQSKLAADRWVFNWDARRSTGYLLALPRTSDRKEIQFEFEWK